MTTVSEFRDRLSFNSSEGMSALIPNMLEKDFIIIMLLFVPKKKRENIQWKQQREQSNLQF